MKEVLKGKNVLIVDDNTMNIFALSSYLKSVDMNVYVAENGYEAIELLLNQADVDIVLLDMMMPRMDGYETIARIREYRQMNRIPIIAVTANAMKGDREKCLKAGATDYVSKPIELRELLAKMDRLLKQEG